MKKNLIFSFSVVLAFFLVSCEKEKNSEVIIDFQSLNLETNSYWNGSDGSGGKKIGIATFTNTFNDWGGGFTSWTGFAFSNVTDISTSGVANQYSAMVSENQVPTNVYSVVYCMGNSTHITFDWLVEPMEVDVTNSTYAYYSMLNGDEYSKKFGGADGTDSDWFLLTIEGYNGTNLTNSVEFYLADFRFTNSAQDYIVNKWNRINLSSLGSVNKIVFKLTSSDSGEYGMNTPSYLAIDNIKFTQK